MEYVRDFARQNVNVNILPIVCNPSCDTIQLKIKTMYDLFPLFDESAAKQINIQKTISYINTLLDIYNRTFIIEQINNSFGSACLNSLINELIYYYRKLGYKGVPPKSKGKQEKIDFVVSKLGVDIINCKL